MDIEDFRKKVRETARSIVREYVNEHVVDYVITERGKRIYFPAKKWDVEEKLMIPAYVAAYMGEFLLVLDRESRKLEQNLKKLKRTLETL
jgi:hypothetical protein